MARKHTPLDGLVVGLEADAAALNGERPPPGLAAGEPEVGNTLQAYLREIRRAPLLTPEEEFATASRAWCMIARSMLWRTHHDA